MKKMSIQKGVVFLFNERTGVCSDVEIQDFVRKIEFPGITSGIAIYKLRNLNKAFEKIESLIIDDGVIEIEISNYMFPNVREVLSHDKKFFSAGSTLCKNGMLKNVFCLQSDEIADLNRVRTICNYAFEGCRTNAVCNGYNVTRCEPHAFDDSVMYTLPYVNDCVQMVANIIIGFNPNAQEIFLPDASLPYVGLMDGMSFPKGKTVVMHKFETMKEFCRNHCEPETINLLDDNVSENDINQFFS